MNLKRKKILQNVKKTSGIAICGAVIIAGIIVFQLYDSGLFQDGVLPDDFQTVGPLTINNSKYLLGENVFGWLSLHPLEDGEVTFYRPNGIQHYQTSFNGSLDPDPKFYFRANIEPLWDICTKDDVVGTWTVIVTGKTLTEDRKNLTQEPKEMTFRFLDKTLPGIEERWEGNKCE
jgi:hypothetical protein